MTVFPPLNSIINHKLVYGMLSILGGILLLTATFPASVNAYPTNSSPNQCAVPSALNGWNYKQKIVDIWPAFSPDTVQKDLLIYEVWNSDGTADTIFQYADEIKFKLLNDGTYGVTKNITSVSQPNWPFRDYTGTSNDGYYLQNFRFSPDPTSGNYQTLGYWSGTTPSTGETTFITNWSETPAAGQVKCIASGINVLYESNYDGRRYDPLAVNNGLGLTGQDNCTGEWWKPWEKPVCLANKAFNATTNALTQAGKDIANGFTAALSFLFIPDEGYISGLFDDASAYWNEKLGFLAFPIIFMADLFDALTTSSNYSNCSESSCIRNFGNFFGSNLSINFSQMHTVSPQLWQFVLLVMRITAIYFFINSLYRIGVQIMSNRGVH